MQKTNSRTPVYLLFILSLGYIMAVLDTTGVVLAVPHIEKAMSVSLEQSIWIINAYTLALGSLLLLAGNLTTKYGAKRILLAGMAIFTLSSIGCSFSPTIESLIALRFVQGLGAALFMPSSLALLFLSYPDATKRARMLGIWTAIISVATGTGSFIGGMIINFFGWRGIFLINIPFGILAILSIFFLVKKNIAQPKTKIDFFSNILLVATIGSLVIYLVEGNQYGYQKLNLLFFLLLTLLFAIALVLRDKKSQAPIVPHQLLKNAKFIVSNLLGLVVNISLYGIVLVLGLYFQTYLNLSSMVSGLLILPGMIVLIFGNLFYARAVKRFSVGSLATVSILFAIAGATGIFAIGLVMNQVPLPILITLFALMSLGIGVLTPATTTLLMEVAGSELSGIAGATLNANKQIGGLFGTTIMGIVTTNLSGNWNMVVIIAFFINILLYVATWLMASRYLYGKK